MDSLLSVKLEQESTVESVQDTLVHLGLAVRELRHRQGLTQKQLAEEIGKSETLISHVERGRIPSLSTLSKIAHALGRSVDSLLYEAQKLAWEKEDRDFDQITRSIEFAPDHYQAGMAILSYFDTILRQRFPDTKAKVRIEQEGLRVRLVIVSPTGEMEIIEKTLQEYGLVVIGKMNPSDLLANPQHVLQLENKLEIAHMEIRLAQRQLEFERNSYEGRIISLEEEVEWLRDQVGGLLAHGRDKELILASLQNLADRIATQQDETLRTALSLLGNLIEHGTEDAEEENIKMALMTVRKETPGLFERIRDFSNRAASSAAGRFLYDVISSLPV